MGKTLNDKFIAALKPAPKGKRYEIMDRVVPGLGVRVTSTGQKTYILKQRFAGSVFLTRRAIAPVGAVTLPVARAKAREWLEKISAGIDPKVEEAAKAKAEARLESNAFVKVAEDYFAERLKGIVSGDDIERYIRREFCGPWSGKQIDEIEPSDVSDIVRAVARRAPFQARDLLGHIRRLFDWAVAAGKITLSPCGSIKPKTLFGKLDGRDRVLNDDELRAVWNEAAALRYPYGPIYQLLIVLGLRLNEVARGRWSEIDMKNKVWVLPGARMKKRLAHVVPLCDQAMAVLESLPRWNGGDFLFSNTNGEKPVTVYGRLKENLDQKVGFSDWINHDLRRTMRTHLSRLPIEEHVRELMIAHRRKGIAGVYDKYAYFDEKRVGFDLWDKRLAGIVEPAAGNVVRLRR